MGTVYEEEMGTSILLVYCSDNDCPDKFFPADPRLVQAHRDAQNEPRPPPTPPASPVSGIATPSTGILAEFWEVDRSPTPSPTFDVAVPENLATKENHITDVIKEIDISQLSLDQTSNGSKKSVSFSLRIEHIEYGSDIDPKMFSRFMSKMRKKDSKKRQVPKPIKESSRSEAKESLCPFSIASQRSQSIFKKIASAIGISSKSKTYRSISFVARRVKSFKSRIID